MSYGILGSYSQQASQIFGRMGQSYASGLAVAANPFLCCGTTALHSFGKFSLTRFEDKAAFLAGLFGVNGGRTHYIYVITEQQATVRGSEHALLAEIGSVKVCEFKSLQHSPWNLLQVFVCDINGAKGKYLDAYGQALKAPPEVAPAPRPSTVILAAPPPPPVEPPAPAVVAKPVVKRIVHPKKDEPF